MDHNLAVKADGLKGTENTYEFDAAVDPNSTVLISEIFWALDDSAVCNEDSVGSRPVSQTKEYLVCRTSNWIYK
ncbi:hypothetical protein D3C83_122310 [compost metagenome]